MIKIEWKQVKSLKIHGHDVPTEGLDTKSRRDLLADDLVIITLSGPDYLSPSIAAAALKLKINQQWRPRGKDIRWSERESYLTAEDNPVWINKRRFALRETVCVIFSPSSVDTEEVTPKLSKTKHG